MPYLTPEWHPTTLLITCGPIIRVNTILGLPFIQATKTVLDAADQVAELCALDMPPFALDFRHAMCTVPSISNPTNDATGTNFANIIKEVARIEALFQED